MIPKTRPPSPPRPTRAVGGAAFSALSRNARTYPKDRQADGPYYRLDHAARDRHGRRRPTRHNHIGNAHMVKSIQKVAIIGTGTIGASWAALFLARGLDVTATDIAPGAEASLRLYIDQAWPALERIGLAEGADRARLRFTADLAAAVAGAELVQENGPERIDFKIALYEQLDNLLPAQTLIASSSSGLTMSAIQAGCKRHPERCVIGHPFNPPHLIPLVEIVGGKLTSEETIARATAFYDGLGKRTVRLHKEMPGHVANRLAAALFREIVYLVSEGVLSVADADTAVCW